ncbi:hypothetical protein [Candidatus Phyllobacterium onerii]|uniref:hypothetical protein n=1 Tax=Candidatus Phyllobacterium onerii TaxID=3020828 RepID=UPI0023306E98|nr:hypothetical protein [Phyllobacterium sp. IY22]
MFRITNKADDLKKLYEAALARCEHSGISEPGQNSRDLLRTIIPFAVLNYAADYATDIGYLRSRNVEFTAPDAKNIIHNICFRLSITPGQYTSLPPNGSARELKPASPSWWKLHRLA